MFIFLNVLNFLKFKNSISQTLMKYSLWTFLFRLIYIHLFERQNYLFGRERNREKIFYTDALPKMASMSTEPHQNHDQELQPELSYG